MQRVTEMIDFPDARKTTYLNNLEKNANNKSKQYLIYFQKTYKTKAMI